MWIYLVSLTISSAVTGAILSVLIPKLKKKEEKENAFAATNKIVFPDGRLKVTFISFSVFLLLISLMVLFFRPICELLEFDWLITNIVLYTVLIFDLIIILSVYRIKNVSYNNDFLIITNVFFKTKKIMYYQIDRIEGNVKIVVGKKKYNISHSVFYGVQGLKEKIIEKISGNYSAS